MRLAINVSLCRVSRIASAEAIVIDKRVSKFEKDMLPIGVGVHSVQIGRTVRVVVSEGGPEPRGQELGGRRHPGRLGDVREGDNLYTDSLIAVDLATGEMKWHFQFTPHDVWDWDAQEPPLLLDIDIEGETRKVVVQANRSRVCAVERTVESINQLGVHIVGSVLNKMRYDLPSALDRML